MKNIIISLFLIFILIILKKPVFYGLISSAIYIYIYSLIKGYNYKNLNRSLIKGIFSAKNILIILSLIGVLTSIWMACGTIPFLMYLGLGMVKKYNFIFFSFLIMSIISYILGTAVGSISTLGVVIIGIGRNLGLDTSLLAGAIVSGAFLGDRSSPLSSAFNLTIEMSNSNPIDSIRRMNTTLIPAFVLSGFIYYIFGMYYTKYDTTCISSSLDLIKKSFNINMFCLIPVIILFLCIILRINIIISIITSIVSSFIIGFIIQDSNFIDLIKIGIFGFNDHTSVISGGGFLSMVKVLITIASATAFTGLLQELNLLEHIINKFTQSINNYYTLLIKTGLLSIILNIITCSQVIGIIIPASFMKSSFENFKLNNEYLVHCISDTGNITVPLIPWNINSIVASTVLGISSINFIPYSFLCYLLPIMFIIKYKLHPPI